MLFTKPVEATEGRKFVGRIESVDRHFGGYLSRYTFIIDAVDAGLDFDSLDKDTFPWKRNSLSLVRIMTTARKFAEVANRPDSAENPDDLVGQWIALYVGPRRRASGPLAQVCPLGERGYDSIVNYSVEDIELFEVDPELPRSLGAAGNRGKQLAASLFKAGQKYSSPTSAHQLSSLQHSLRRIQPQRIRVMDVGHANFVSIIDDGKSTAIHFDVGWPISYNMHTAPSVLPVPDKAGIVILSHWDWDHLHGYHVWPMLKNCLWVTPVQDLGPGALFVARQLAASGKLISIGPFSSWPKRFSSGHNLVITYGDPRHCVKKSEIRNNSGLVLTATLSNGKVALLPGDADYKGVKWNNPTNPDLLVIPHHGAAVQGAVQQPRVVGSPAVLSLGAGNVYRHPCATNLAQHRAAGWVLSSTCASSIHPRGDRFLV